MDFREQLIAFITIVRKEIKRVLRIWTQSLVPPVITITLYFIIFGSLIGRRIGTMSGVSYMEFVVPGLIMMAVITNSFTNVVSSFFGAKFQRFVEEMLVSPTPNYVILLGFAMGGVFRGLVVGLIVTIVALFFTDLQVHSVSITIAIVVMTSVFFSMAGFINAVYARTFDDISIIPTFVLTPLIYLGGVFYSTDMLPEFWSTLSQFNPILYIVNAFRYGLLGITDVSVGLSFAMVTLFIVITFIFSLRALSSANRLRS